MQPLAAKNGTYISWETPEAQSIVYGDRQRLRQVLANLLGNAIKFTTDGEIIVRSRHQGDNPWLVEVKDNGRRMNEKELDALFDPYLHNTRDRTNSSGLRIGLVRSKQYIELHKGRIWAKRMPGKGTTFCFFDTGLNRRTNFKPDKELTRLNSLFGTEIELQLGLVSFSQLSHNWKRSQRAGRCFPVLYLKSWSGLPE